jgi:uncharacterized protein
MLDKTRKINDLLDWYEELLTQHQREVMHMYYHDDYSLREIAEILNISHNAVFDIVKRVEKMLLAFEEKVGALDFYQKNQQMISDLKALNEASVHAIIDTFEKNTKGEKND